MKNVKIKIQILICILTPKDLKSKNFQQFSNLYFLYHEKRLRFERKSYETRVNIEENLKEIDKLLEKWKIFYLRKSETVSGTT